MLSMTCRVMSVFLLYLAEAAHSLVMHCAAAAVSVLCLGLFNCILDQF